MTSRLIPLFAVGAFSAFLFSQAGMVKHWLKSQKRRARIKLLFNGLGALTTSVTLPIIVISKFIEGAWVTVVVMPALFSLLIAINRHYESVKREVQKPLKLQAAKLRPPVAIIPIEGWNRVAEKAIRFALSLSDDIIAVHVATEGDDKRRFKELWLKNVENPAKAAHLAVPQLVILDSPYRRIYRPILDFVSKTKREKPGQLIAVIIPELVEPHWYEYLLHNLHGAGLKTLLYIKGDQRTIVINTPWHLRDV